MQSRTLLHRDNYSRGFLIDDEWMASVTEFKPENSLNFKENTAENASEDGFAAFVMNHVTGETVGYRVFPTLDEALEVLNAIPRTWKFESTSGCSGERCGEGKCKGTGCKIFVPKNDAKNDPKMETDTSCASC